MLPVYHGSRFLELHVDDIPDGELATILHRRCDVAPSYAAKMVATMRELQRQRQACTSHPANMGLEM